MPTLTGKTIGQLNFLSGVTSDTLIPVELSGSTYHINFSSTTNANQYLNAGNSNTDITINWALANVQEINLNDDPTISFTNSVPGKRQTLLLKQELIGQRTITWDNNLIWSNSDEPIMQNIPYSGGGDIDTSFVIGTGFNSGVQTIQLQPDGKIISGGNFTSYNGESYGRIIRLNTDASIDDSFIIDTGFDDGFVTSITLQPDDKIVVGGTFTSYSGESYGRIIRLNTNGSIDTNFLSDIGFNNQVNTIKLQSDNKILVGGLFTSYSGISSSRIIRLNTNGSVDTNLSVENGFNNTVNDIVTQSDGKVIVGGAFTTYGGNGIVLAGLNNNFTPSTISSNVNTAIKDNSGDLMFGYGTGIRKVNPINGSTIYDVTTDSSVTTLESLSGTSILVGGNFTTYSGISNNGLLKINSSGYKDNTFDIGNGFLGSVLTTQQQSDGKVLVGGSFSVFNNTQINTSFSKGFNGNVYDMVEQSDGKLLAVGSFISYNDVSYNNIIRLNSDGSIDNSFVIGLGLNNIVTAIKLQPDGKILVGGNFTSYSGASSNRIIRLNTNGSVDTSFVIGTGFTTTVNAIELQSDGKILVGGAFTSYSGVSRNRIIRLNTDGSVDTSFVIGTGFNNTVNTITLQSDGKILAGGDFTTYSGVSRNRIIRLNTDGSVDTGFVIGTGFTTSVSTIALQPDGKILVGGGFTTYSGVSRNFIIRLNTNGSVDTSFVIGTGFNSSVSEIALQSDGKILVGGSFTSYSGVTANRSILLNSDGSVNTSFILSGSSSGANDIVRGFLPKSGFTYVYGDFETYNGISQLSLSSVSYSAGTAVNVGNYIRLNSNGSYDSTFSSGTGFTSSVYEIKTQSDGKIIVATDSTFYSGTQINGIVRLNSDNSLDQTFYSPYKFDLPVKSFAIQSDGKIIAGGDFSSVRVFSNFSTLPSILDFTIQSDGKILVGGTFTSYNGVSVNNIIRLNSDYSIDPTFNIGTGFNSSVSPITLQSDGKILVGGFFTSYSGVSRNYIVRLNTDGSVDNSFVIGTGFSSGGVNTIALQPDGKILVGGEFASYSGVSSNRIIRLNTNGSIDNSFVVGTGFTNTVRSISLQSDGKILVGGVFTSYSGVSSNRIIRLNTDGSVDNSFVIGTGFTNDVLSIVLQSDGKILVGGFFISYSGVSRNYIIRLNTDGSVDNSFVIGTGFNNTVRTIQLQSDGKILVGGSFTSYSGITNPSVILLNQDGSKNTSFNSGAFGVGVGRTITAVLTQSNGNILIGGNQDTYNNIRAVGMAVLSSDGNYNQQRRYIARLNVDGTIDSTFNSVSGFNGSVSGVTIQPDGKVLVAGSFTSYSGITSNRLARLNSDGSYDTTFSVNPGFNTSATTVSLVSNNYVLVGGDFTSYSGISTTRLVQLGITSLPTTNANGIIRLNTDGSVDNSFVIGTGFDNQVLSIGLQSDGKIIAGGAFSSYSGVSRNRFIRLNTDGSIDNSFVIGTGFNGTVQSIQIQSDSKILVGGNYTSYSGVSRNNFIRLNTNGSVDTSFVIGAGFNSSINDIKLQPNAKILVGGQYTSYDSNVYNRFIRLDGYDSQTKYNVVNIDYNGTYYIGSF
jgi:uncharacterized delta-60 repeat protein